MSKFAQLIDGYRLVVENQPTVLQEMLQQTTPDITQDSLIELATWVWLDCHVNEAYTEILDSVVCVLQAEWGRKELSIWNKDQDVHLATLSSVYGALLAVKHRHQKPALQQQITEIRDYVFTHLLKGGTVLNGLQTRKISIDQLLSVLPFGLFSPEDLVMVEAVKVMEQQLVTDEGVLPFTGAADVSSFATSLLALYFLEKKDIRKAEHYIHLAQKIEHKSPLDGTFLAINTIFQEKFQTVGAHIKHSPLGNENPYEPQRTERLPHFPEVTEQFAVSCEVIAEQSVAEVSVLFIESKEKISCKREKDDIWKGVVPPRNEKGVYSYYFEATFIDGTQLISEQYSVETITEHYSESATIYGITDGFAVTFHDGDRSECQVVFQLESDELQMNVNPAIINYETAILEGNGLVKNGDLEMELKGHPVRLEVRYRGEILLQSHAIYPAFQWYSDRHENIVKFKIHLDSPQEEAFFGFGERYNELNQRGNLLDCYVYNQYRDQGTRTYIPTSFYHTNRSYSIFIDTTRYTSFDLGKQLADKHSIVTTLGDEPVRISIFAGDVKTAIAKYVEKTGQPAMLPVWAFGPWMSSNNWDRDQVVREEIETTQKLQIPATVVVLEQWSDEATYYMFNDTEYTLKDPAESYSYEELHFPDWGRWPNPRELTQYVHDNKMKLILWQIPIQKYLNQQQHPLKDLEEAYMIERGYVVKNEDGSPYRIPENWFTNSLIMDFSNKAGSKWWFDKRQYLIDIGIDGFKTDGGEFVFGSGLQFADGRKGDAMRNAYPNDYVEAYYNFAQQNDGMTFSRAGYTGAQRFPAHWAGDERSTFDAFRRSLIAGLSAGLSGLPFWSWDFAGFNGDIPTAELFLRSAAMAAFCPIMQYHAESKGEFNQDRTPWNIAERTEDTTVIPIYRHFANVRMNLLPYIYNEARKSVMTGLPMMRALMLEFPNDARVADMFDQYLFGEHLLVAPIIEEGAWSREVYLPEGIWYKLWTNEKVTGPTVQNYTCDTSEIPVFVKTSTVILCNVDETLQLGSWVGNDVSRYHRPLLKIYIGEDFEEIVTDHIGNRWEIGVSNGGEMIQINTNITEDYTVELIGAPKKSTVKKGRCSNENK
ncbi:glycoside hydrolase family 31 protein [Listeria booriae]|uniref:glycoside hydrolase family 31 protein n=1 Tax=Listeria booriae TaxID=1552123 RepID=UPI0017BB956B|nr:glycoside hydrolase family 31 protein [Listeria booriae]MBC2316321.1 glycoside hydrolase family 31 protein [Listeria booriae]